MGKFRYKKTNKKNPQWQPVEKPNAKHMPICTKPGCNRKVSDARRTRCKFCMSPTTILYQR